MIELYNLHEKQMVPKICSKSAILIELGIRKVAGTLQKRSTELIHLKTLTFYLLGKSRNAFSKSGYKELDMMAIQAAKFGCG